MTAVSAPTPETPILPTAEEVFLKEVPPLKRLLGPETYRILKGLLTKPMSIAGIAIIGLFALIALAAPILAPVANVRDPYIIPRDGFAPNPQPPGSPWLLRPPPLPFWWKAVTGQDNWFHIMGTAGGQWDIWYGVIWGTRTAFRTGVVITIFTLLIGIFMGSLAAYYGGWVDTLLMRITEIFVAIPFFMAALIFAAVIIPLVGKGELPAIIAIVAFGWMTYARLIRGDILSIREREYVTAARALGERDAVVLIQHIIPNAIYPTLVYASLAIGEYVLTFAALSFLGIGTEIGHADWGQILSFARNYIPSLATFWYILVFPGMAVVLFVLGWNLVGDALRDITDPRLRGKV